MSHQNKKELLSIYNILHIYTNNPYTIQRGSNDWPLLNVTMSHPYKNAYKDDSCTNDFYHSYCSYTVVLKMKQQKYCMKRKREHHTFLDNSCWHLDTERIY